MDAVSLVLRTTDTGILEPLLASIDQLHFILRLRLLIGTPNALSSGKAKRRLWWSVRLLGSGAVLAVIDIQNRCDIRIDSVG